MGGGGRRSAWLAAQWGRAEGAAPGCERVPTLTPDRWGL